MPTYQYLCKDCGNVTEELRMISKMDDANECPKCKSTNSTREFNISPEYGMVFKGWGWHDKNVKMANDRMAKSKHMGKIQRDNHPRLGGNK